MRFIFKTKIERFISLTEYVRKEKWCNVHGWTEPFFQDSKWYAFPPNAVIPQPIPIAWCDYGSSISQLFYFLLYRLLMLAIIYSILEVIAQF
ncbi:MAG: hypothetical protein QNJ18_18905 [Xenococcaceae cyanobacterium MO_167.B52]|nr:hypothetical protein [Xenococcaceae cyanobacterium MO_167.B52]